MGSIGEVIAPGEVEKGRDLGKEIERRRVEVSLRGAALQLVDEDVGGVDRLA